MQNQNDKPTDKQIRYAESLARKAGVPLPADARSDKTQCSAFIKKYQQATPTSSAPKAEEKSIPSEAQCKLVDSIAKALPDRVIPEEHADALSDVAACRAFIDAYKTLFDEHREHEKAIKEELAQAKAELKAKRQLESAVRWLEIITPALRKSVADAPTYQEKHQVVTEYKAVGKRGFTQLDATKLESINLKLVGYWLEGLKSTAFDALGNLENLLGGKPARPITQTQLRQRLSTETCEGLKFDRPQSPPVRHLVFKLEKTVQGKPVTRVLSVLPLQAVALEGSKHCGWALSKERVPLFNRNLLGESANLPGLMFDEVESYDRWVHRQMALKPELTEALPAVQSLEDALKLWDEAFKVLSGSSGLGDWIERFLKTQANFPALKYYKPVFTLVDGGAVKGASQHVCNAYGQLLADATLIDSDALGLFKRLSQIDQPGNSRPYEPLEQQRSVDHLLAYFGHMDSFKKGKREAYALDPAQRDALIALGHTEPAELLAVNGPPGTGKTSLLRGVIASAWVQPLLSADEAPDSPVIIACAATNQAVTNVISSFQETPGPALFDGEGELLEGATVALDSRWVPYLNSYGWFAPPSDNDERRQDYGNYQWVLRKNHREPWTFDGSVQPFQGLTAQKLEAGFLRCARVYFGKALSLAEAVDSLHQQVRSGYGAIVEVHRCLTQWLDQIIGLQDCQPWMQRQETTRKALLEQKHSHQAEYGTRARLQGEVERINSALARLAPIVDFDQLSDGYAQFLNQLSPDDPLVIHGAYLRTRQTLELANSVGVTIKKQHYNSVIQWIEDKLAAVLSPGSQAKDLARLAEALRACGVTVTAENPGYDEYARLLEERVRVLHRQMHGQAGEGLSMYMSRYAVDLPLDELGRKRWPALVDEYRSRLRQERATLIGQLEALEQQHADVDTQLAQLQQQWTLFQAVVERMAGARAAFEQSLHRVGVDLTQPMALVECLQLVGACAQIGQPLSDDFFKHMGTLLKHVQDWLDVNVRTGLFHGAARYWEGRYILSRHVQADNRKKDEAWVASSAAQLRDLAMLAPVFVVTAYSAPKLMRCDVRDLSTQAQPYLFGMADLLIVDEAGQGTPEIGASAFMFARKAIVVGDVEQLEPVWAMEKASDTSLVQRFELAPREIAPQLTPYRELEPSGALLASGSVMRMAQKVSQWFTPAFAETPGLTLTNHYRCLKPIISICNDMVYGGDLNVVTRVPATLWRPELQRLGFLVTEEVKDTKHSSGSRRNIKEAQCIAQWLHENEASIVAHYAEPLSDVVAIVTPFKGQIPVLKRALAERFGLQHKMDDEHALHNLMVIDTVHSLQGAEKQIVIFAMVDTHEPGARHFYDNGANLINVAVSRAKEMFIVALSQNAVDHGRMLKPEALDKPSDYLWHAVATRGSRLNQRRLVLVESPHKRGVIHAALGDSIEWEIQATEGHISQMEEPQKWDAAQASAPVWGPLSDAGRKLFERVTQLWFDLDTVYLATDADAEGELIAWHCLRVLQESLSRARLVNGGNGPEIRRVRFNNLEPATLREAFDQAGHGLDAGLVKSALTRSLLDHLLRTQYPVRIGRGKPNAPAKGIGRVQLGILDLVNKAAARPARYALQVDIPLSGGEVLKTFACPVASDQSAAIWHTMDLERADKACKVIQQKLHKPVVDLMLQLTLGPVQQLDTYPALNTARMLALGWRAARLWPERVMEAMQALYEGQTAISAVVLEKPAPATLELESEQ